MYNLDLKHEKLMFLSTVFQNEILNPKGVYHMHRQIPKFDLDIVTDIVVKDILKLVSEFDEGKITFLNKVVSDSTIHFSITMRLENGSIVKYTLVSNTFLAPRLRLNFSVAGRVFEYDDEKKYLDTNILLQTQDINTIEYTIQTLDPLLSIGYEVAHD